VPDEDALGEELVVLSCLHAFCQECIADWREHSQTCPLCRRELDAREDEEADSWILTSPDLSQLRASYQRLIDHPFTFVRSRPIFRASSASKSNLMAAASPVLSATKSPAADASPAAAAAALAAAEQQQRKRAALIRTPGDALSLVVSEVIDVLAPSPSRSPSSLSQQQQQQQQQQQFQLQQQAGRKEPAALPVAHPVVGAGQPPPPSAAATGPPS